MACLHQSPSEREKLSEQLINNPKLTDWRALEEAYQFSIANFVSTRCTSLTYASVYLDSFRKMSNSGVIAVVNPRTISLLEYLRDKHPDVVGAGVHGLIAFLTDLYVLVDAFASSAGFTSPTDARLLDCVRVLKLWQRQREYLRQTFDHIRDPDFPDADSGYRLLHFTDATYSAVCSTVAGFILLLHDTNPPGTETPVPLCMPNTDPVEMLFSTLRQSNQSRTPTAPGAVSACSTGTTSALTRAYSTVGARHSLKTHMGMYDTLVSLDCTPAILQRQTVEECGRLLPPGGVRIPPAYEQSDAWSDVVCDDIDQLCAAAQEAHDAYQPLPSTIAAVTAALCGMPPELAAPLQACLRDTANCASFLTYIQGDCDFSVLNKRDKTRVTVGTHLYVFHS